jgi:lipopolysaccharide/colanic/teichoic acid biosynthesis glycosyltransferase
MASTSTSSALLNLRLEDLTPVSRTWEDSAVKPRPPLPRTRYLSRLHIAVGSGDIAILLGAYVANSLLTSSVTRDFDTARLAVWCAALVVLWVPLALNLRAYAPDVIAHPLQSPYVITKVTLLVGAVFHLLPLVGGPVDSRIARVSLVLTLAGALAFWRLLLSRFAPVVTTPVELVVVGTGGAARTLANALVPRAHGRMRIAAFVDDQPAIVGRQLAGVPVYSPSQFAAVVRNLEGRARIVLANEEEKCAAIYDELTTLAQEGIEVVSMASVYEQETGRIPVRHLGNFWWAALPRPSADLVYLTAKRMVDVVVALFGLLLLCAILPVLGPLLMRETGGSLFFKQTRIGRYGKPFTIFKLRTLAPSFGTHVDFWERKKHNRPMRLGSILRDSGLDELPQCLNILRGEMTLVGPRPYLHEEVADLERQIPFFRSRALAKPGITGWAQVHFGYGLSLEDEVEKLQYDLYYLGHQSPYLDLLIVLRTCALVLARRKSFSTAGPRSLEHRPIHASARRLVSYVNVKSLLDRVAGALALLLLSPCLVVLALAVWADSAGPVIFRQRRIGQHGHAFTIYKFRSMHVDAPSYSLKVRDDDPRVTRVGRLLRRTALDELPQLWNIVRGEMSWVGPRPEQPFLVERYTTEERARLLVRPGLTGWWQVCRRGDQRMRMHEHTQLDLYYVDHVSLWLDLKILLLTPWAIWKQDQPARASHAPQHFAEARADQAVGL